MRNLRDKVMSVVLSACILLNLITPVLAVEKTVLEIEMPVQCSESTDLSSIKFYGYEDDYYLDIETIAKLTRFELEEKDDKIIFSQGTREVTISQESGQITDFSSPTGKIKTLFHDDKLLLDGVPMLKYLGASCDINENGILVINMPWITLWEAMMPDYEEYCFDINTLYGGKKNVEISVGLDLAADFLNAFSDSVFPPSREKRFENAFLETLSVDMNPYEGVRKIVVLNNQRIYEYLSLEHMTKEFQQKYEESLGNNVEVLGLAEEILEESLEYIWMQDRDTAIKKWENAFISGDRNEINTAALNSSKTVYQHAAQKASLNELSDYQNFLETVVLAAEILSTSNSLISYDETTKNLLYNSVNEDILIMTDMTDIEWKHVADNITKKLSSNPSIVFETAYEEISNHIFSEFVDESASQLLSYFFSNGNVYYLIAKMSLVIGSLAFKDLFEAYSEDLLSIDINNIQSDVLNIMNAIQQKAADEDFQNEKTLFQLQQLYILYYRLIIAYSENFAGALEEFGGKHRKEWVKVFADKEGGSYCNYAASYLYLMSNCTIDPIRQVNEKYDRDIRNELRAAEKATLENTKINDSENISYGDVNDYVKADIEKSVGLLCKWYINLDVDGDGNKEIYAFCCESDLNFRNGQIWKFTVYGAQCLFYLNEAQGEGFYNIVCNIPAGMLLI